MWRRFFNLAMCFALAVSARGVSAQTVKVATLTVNGSEQMVGGNWDAANISVSFNGYIEMVNYAQYSTPASLASALAAMFTRDYNGYGLYAKSGANSNTDPNVITFHLVNGQAFTSIDYTLPNTSFSLVPSGFGSTASTLADSGTVTLSITPPGGSPTAISTTRYGDGSTPETIAQGLASAASSNLVTVNANGALLYLTSRQTGSSTDYPFSITVTHDTADFPNPSFQIAPLSGSLAGGSTPSTQSTTVNLYCYSVTTGGPGPCNPNASGTSGYQANGNLANVSDSVMGSWSYSYDNLNRLTGSTEIANGPYANPYNCWSYDSFGNRTNQANSNSPFTNSAGSPCQTSSSTPIQTLASFGSNNQLTSLKPANATAAITPTYDAAGNMTFDGTNTYLYDAESRVCAVHGPFGMTGYQYDADGNRIGKGSITSMSCDLTANGYQAQSDYVLDAGGGQMSEMAVAANGSEVWQHTNVTAGGALIATYDTTGLHFYLNDALGSRRAQTDGYGVLEQTCQSLPFGDGLNCSLSNAAPTEHHFTGKERDTESGLDYFGARYYASNMGRFQSPDWAASAEPVPYAKLVDPQSLNLYAYLRNNPLSGVDIDGHQIDCSGTNAADAGCQAIAEWNNDHEVSASEWANSKFDGAAEAAQREAQQQTGDRPQTTDSVTVTAKPSVWKKIGGWFGNRGHDISYAMTAFIITHSKLAMEGNKSSFEYWSKQSNEDIIKSLNPGGKEPMQIRMDGEDARIINGNMRYSILQSRGADLSGLKPEVLPPVMLEPMVEPMIEPEIIP